MALNTALFTGDRQLGQRIEGLALVVVVQHPAITKILNPFRRRLIRPPGVLAISHRQLTATQTERFLAKMPAFNATVQFTPQLNPTPLVPRL